MGLFLAIVKLELVLFSHVVNQHSSYVGLFLFRDVDPLTPLSFHPFCMSSLLPPSLQLLLHLASSTWSRTLHLQALGTHSLTAPVQPPWELKEKRKIAVFCFPFFLSGAEAVCLTLLMLIHWDKSSTKSVYPLGANTMILLPNYIFSDFLVSRINNTTGCKRLTQSHVCLLQSF